MERLSRNVNRHHAIYTGREVRRFRIWNMVRTHPGLILPIYIPDHRDLHHHLRASVPRPDTDAARYFLEDVITPYRPGQPRTKQLDEAIRFFSQTNNELTAEHLSAQREFILRTPIIGEGELGGYAA